MLAFISPSLHLGLSLFSLANNGQEAVVDYGSLEGAAGREKEKERETTEDLSISSTTFHEIFHPVDQHSVRGASHDGALIYP